MKNFAECKSFLIRSMMLVLCVVCSTVSVWGADPVASVARKGGTTTNYTSFTTAWSTANNATVETTITLLDDVTVTSQLKYNNSNTQNCTLDLNGHTLTSTTDIQSPLLINKSGVTFTITDNSANKSGKLVLNTTFSTNAIYGAYVQSGNLTLAGGTIEVNSNTNTTGGVSIVGSFTMNGGTIHVKATGSGFAGRAVYTGGSGTATINNGDIIVEADGAAQGVRFDKGSITVKGGKFSLTGDASTTVTYIKDGATPNVTITGGQYSTETGLADYCPANYYVFPNADATYPHRVARAYTLTWEVNGGNPLTGDYTQGLTEVGATVTPPADPTREGYVFAGWNVTLAATMPAANTTYTATWTPVVASVKAGDNTNYYATFDAAWSAAVSAASAATLTLLQNVSGLSSTSTYSAAHNLTLDLNGHTLSGSGSITSLFQVNCEYTFTVTDGTVSKNGKISYTASSAFYCVIVSGGTFVLEAGKLDAISSSSSNGNIGCVQVNGGTFIMNENGALHANYTGSGSGKNSRAVYANGGTTTINGGTIRVESNVAGIGIAYTNGAVVTVNGGWFNVTATGSKAITNNTNESVDIHIQGGYYNMSDNYLTRHVKAPYYVVSNSDATYQYRVAERYTVTFNNYDGTSLQSDLWEKGATPAYSGETPTKSADAQYTYTFDSWSPAIASVTADAAYTAQFSSTVNNYTVTVAKNEDGYGSISSTEVASVPYGSAVTVSDNTLTVNGTTVTATPATSDAQYTYTFSGWTNAPETVTGDVTVTANFTRAINKYTITFKNGEDVLQSTEVEYGATPAYNGATPTKAATAQYTYSFNGWDAALVPVTGDATYTATFTETLLQAKASVAVGDGEPVGYATFDAAWSAAVAAGDAVTVKLLADVSNVAMLTYTYNQNCTLDLNGHKLTSSASQAAIQVNNANIIFTVTDSSNDKNGKIYINASHTTNAYGVLVSAGNFVLNGGTIEAHLKATTSHGVRVAAGASFSMSDGTIDVVTTNSKNGDGVFANGTATISGGTVRVNAAGTGNAVETSGTVTITGGYFNADGSSAACIKRNNNSSLTLQGGVYNLSTNLDGSCATNYYVFTNSDATYQYKVAEGYTINFNNYDGTSLQSGVWEKGTTPAYSGETPTKPADAQYTYTFNGWSTAITEVTANTTYTATYTATLIQVAASVTVGNGEPANYATWDAAWTAATGAASASTITLLQNVTGLSSSMTYSASHNLTLDLNGHTLSGSGSITSLFQVNCSEYTFTVTDGTVSKNGKISYTASSAFYCVIVSGGTFVLEAGKLDAISSSSSNGNIGCVQVNNGGAFTMEENGALHANYKGSGSGKNSRAVYANGGTTIINGGTIRVESTVVGIGIAYTKGTVTVNGGWFNITATDTKIVTNKTSATDNLNIRGGYYNISGSGTYLDLHVKAPYHVFPNSDATYQYKVAEGYTVTFNNYDGTSLQSGAWEPGATPSYTGATPTKPADAQYTYTFTGWDAEIVPATADATYTAQFSSSAKAFTVIWKDADGNVLETDVNVPYGATPQYNGSAPTKAATDQCSYMFAGWTPEVVSVTADVTYVASFQSMTTVAAEQTKTITSNAYITTTTVEAGGKLNVEDNRTLYTETLILKATPSSSGEISGNVAATQNACFDFSQPGGFKARTWYAVAVPWQVDVPAYNKANCGVYTKCGTGSFVQQEMGRTFDLIYYDGARRATGMEKAWNYIEDDAADKHFMYPGRAYMIYLASDADVIRFKKSAGADLHTYEVAVVKHPTELDGTLADWNGISNPATYKAKLDVGTTANKGQVYIPETQQYELFDLDNQLQVGQTVFVQPTAAKTVTAQREIQGGNIIDQPDDPFAAPHRRMKGGMTPPARFEVVLAKEDNQTADRIIVCMDEDKEADKYVVGHDLSKLGVSAVVPQMWVNRYNAQLCINTVAGADNTADYPLGIFVPDAGEYTIAVDQSTNEQSSDTEDSSLYLTYDGKAIWNLSYSDYTAGLGKGDNNRYGLRIIRKAPQTPTGIDEMTIQNGEQVRKVLVDDKIYIIREGSVYSMDGKIVK